MERIASFNVDHRYIVPGVYISRIDGDVTTYDLRTRKPNAGNFMTNIQMHSVEHLFATFIRNSEIKENVIYFGPMGCQTGFYLLIRNAINGQVVEIIKKVLEDIISYNGEIPGNSEIECGNYINLNMKCAKEECKRYYNEIKDIKEKDLNYPE